MRAASDHLKAFAAWRLYIVNKNVASFGTGWQALSFCERTSRRMLLASSHSWTNFSWKKDNIYTVFETSPINQKELYVAVWYKHSLLPVFIECYDWACEAKMIDVRVTWKMRERISNCFVGNGKSGMTKTDILMWKMLYDCSFSFF